MRIDAGFGRGGAVGVLVLACMAGGCRAHLGPAPAAPETAARAILVSIDALAEARVRASLDASAVPNLLEIFDKGACAEYAVPAFPSVTAASHAALWTGAFGDVSGATANSQPSLPRDRRRLTDLASGFSAEVLRAEPLWITVARQGRSVFGHHVTQAPQPPAYLPEHSAGGDAFEDRRAESVAALARPGAGVVNGYNRRIAPHLLLSAESAPPRPAHGWRNAEGLVGSALPPLEVGWQVGPDSVFALFAGTERYDRVVIAPVRDAARGVEVTPAEAEAEPVHGRPLARRFSEPLELHVDGGRVFVRGRLFELAPDASSYLLFVPALHVSDANRADVQESYDDAVRGWIGNSPLREYQNGDFGATRLDGGDGTAEARYLEALELVTRQFIRGAEWAWTQGAAELLMDYFPVADEVDHALYGYLDPDWPDYDERVAAQVQHLRQRIWQLVDLRVGHLRALVAADPSAVLFVAGDHGMRASWQTFRPNAVLREAGLLVLDEQGGIDLSRTRALSPNGYWISVNRVAWRDGIVAPEEEAEVLAAAERALLGLRDAGGRPVVTRVFRAADHAELGLGGPVGGDLYYGTAPGIRWAGAPDGTPLSPASIHAGHGFPSTDRDMWTAFCAVGGGLEARRVPAVRIIDVAPTVADAIGIEAPRDAVGTSVWPRLRGVSPGTDEVPTGGVERWPAGSGQR